MHDFSNVNMSAVDATSNPPVTTNPNEDWWTVLQAEY